MHATETRTWHLCDIAGAVMISGLLLGSWWLPATRPLWDRLDNEFFFLLNGSLAGGGWPSIVWSIANWRPFDAVGGVFLLTLAWFWLRGADANQRRHRIIALALFGTLLICTNLMVQLLQEVLSYSRRSPSLVLEGAVRLSHQVDWIGMKDSSKDCFPGDHAFVVLSTVVFFWRSAGRRNGLAALLLMVPLIFPRLVSGAHWATDVLVGAVPMTLICCSLWFGTPLSVSPVNRIARWAAPLFERIDRWWPPPAATEKHPGGKHETID